MPAMYHNNKQGYNYVYFANEINYFTFFEISIIIIIFLFFLFFGKINDIFHLNKYFKYQ